MKQYQLAEEQLDKYCSISTFVLKTFNILNDPQNASCIAWCDDGKSFTIKNIALLTQKVLPQYFRHHKYESFIRQLNMYNFGKLKNSLDHSFSNKYFIREREDLLKFIKRKPEKKNRRESLVELAMEGEKENSNKLPSLKEILTIEVPEPEGIVKEICEDKMEQEHVIIPKVRKVNFSDTVKDSSDENYSTLIEASNKWINSKQDNCWSNIKSFKSFKSFKITLKILEYNSQNQEQNLVLRERGGKRQPSIMLHADLNDFPSLQQ